MKKAQEDYCFSCERLLLRSDEKLGPICPACYKKTRRRDPLSAAAIVQTLVAVVPAICPHVDDRGHGRCRFSGNWAKHFNVIVLDRNLEPKLIDGPFTIREAERTAKKLRSKVDRRKKKGREGS